jgi:asparagine synthase (glutamine-hydrolysing)
VQALPLVFFGLLPPQLRHPVRRLVRPLAIPAAYRRAWATPEGSARPRFRDALNQAQYDTLTRTMLPTLLRYADRNASAFSREIRLPFLDHRLVEFLFAIPPEERLRGTTTKSILREALRGILPEEIRTRRDKLGFEPPEAAWMRGDLREWIGSLLSSPQFSSRPWVDSAKAVRVWQEFLNGKDAWHPLIWRWISLEIWARVFLDRAENAHAFGTPAPGD